MRIGIDVGGTNIKIQVGANATRGLGAVTHRAGTRSGGWDRSASICTMTS